MSHYMVKSWGPFFQAIKAGVKTHDLRDMKDRDYKVGDTLLLREYDPFDGVYSGDTVAVEITYITSVDTPCAFSSAVLDRDHCILSIKLIEPMGGKAQ